MCTISGGLLGNQHSTSDFKAFAKELATLMVRGSLRGRDSWGFVATDTLGNLKHTRRQESADKSNVDFELEFFSALSGGLSSIIINNRAMPTTESSHNITLEDCQPFVVGNWAVVHNGTIANDVELCEKYLKPNGIQLKTKVDSEVIAGLCEYYTKYKMNFFEFEADGIGLDESVSCMQEMLQWLNSVLIGSYALAVTPILTYKQMQSATIGLLCNYKPIYVKSFGNNDGILFSSLLDDFGNEKQVSTQHQINNNESICKLDAYTGAIIASKPGAYICSPITLHTFSLKPKVEKKKTLVVCSGGLDSTVVATYCVRRGDDVTLLHFQYGCIAEEREQSAVTRVANALNCKVIFFNNSATTREIGGSTLLDPNAKIADMKEGAEYAHEWVPARNLIMLANAVGYAEAHGFDTIALGVNLEESGAYPDNEMIFIQMLNQVLPYATQNGHHVNIEMPVGHLVKHEIVSLGHKLHAPFADSWSCYTNHTDHCGKCGPCGMRKAAFHIAKVEDPTIYEDSSLYNDLNKEE